jgi:3-methyladenine DNA glycosylase AlkD
LSLNDQHLKTINIGLNDKMAFVKNLFGDSNEDYNRVLSQLNTFSTFEEAKDFIDEIIKPDYNNWEGVDDYAERFIEIVAKKFS